MLFGKASCINEYLMHFNVFRHRTMTLGGTLTTTIKQVFSTLPCLLIFCFTAIIQNVLVIFVLHIENLASLSKLLLHVLPVSFK